jgi:uncharacterized protein (DUF1697 family)
MARYAALLRAINLGSRNKIAMPALTKLFDALGHEDVRTYVQSGNVVFTGSGAREDLERGIHDAIADEFGLDITVMVRTAAELKSLVAGNPYLDSQDDPLKLHVTFLASAPESDKAKKLEVPEGETAEFTLAKRDVYLHCPDGYGRTKLSNAFLERKLGVAGTTRNWKTVLALHELTS